MLHLPQQEGSSTLRVGAILAGGRSLRFGSPKQLATIGGVQLVERVARSLRAAGLNAVAITAPDGPDLSHLLPCRVDARPGLGPLGGLHTALLWARDLGLRGILCVGCDLPFLTPALLRRLVHLGEHLPATVLAPESRGPLGLEPLCTWYPTTAADEVARRLDMGALSLSDLLDALLVRRLSFSELAEFGEPERLFHNVNTPAEGAAAEAMISSGERRDGTAGETIRSSRERRDGSN